MSQVIEKSYVKFLDELKSQINASGIKANQENRQVDLFEYEPPEFEFDNILTKYEGASKTKDKYSEEKRKGGLNSYQKYKPLRDKVFKFCKIELKKKKYPSAEYLCQKVAKIIEDQYLSLLDNFEPYQLVLKDGGDWLKPTFYKRVNKFYYNKLK